MKRIAKLLMVLLVLCVAPAKANDIYVAATSAGGNTGADCADAYVYTFFNSSSNWASTGSGETKIGAGTTVHICGTITLSAGGGPVFQFQGSGASGNPVILKWETGAILQAPYFVDAIDFNGKSYITLNGGPTCGETAFATVTACNGIVQNTLAGTSGQTCVGGACTYQLTDASGSSLITDSSGGSLNTITIENLQIGPVYKQGPVVQDNGSSTFGIIFPHDLPTNLLITHNIFKSSMKQFLIAYSDNIGSAQAIGTISYNNFTDQCWAAGIGGSENSGFIAEDWHFDFNEVSNWGYWPIIDGTDDDCHANGTQFFSYSGGIMGDSTSSFNSNYVHGDLTAGYVDSSPSGLLSCQDNCGPINAINNVIVSTCVNPCGGGNLYFNGPGGGGQKVYDNTLVCNTSVSPVVITGTTAADIEENNIIVGCGVVAEIRSDGTTAYLTPENYNDYYSTDSNGWIVYNTANEGTFLTETQWKGSPYNQAANDVTTNPSLNGTTYLPGTLVTGTNLSGTGITGIGVDINGNTRSTWYMGAVVPSGSSPAVSLSPTSLTFSGITIGHSATQTITLTNTGTATLTISSVSISGTGFSQTNSCVGSVSMSGTCPINVTFTPTSSSTVTGTVSITDNAAGSPQTAGLTGSGSSVIPTTPVLTGTLPAGTVGTAYSGGLTGSGGSPPYTWAVSPTLPSPLTMNTGTGAITGTPTAASSATETFTITDSKGSKSTPYGTTLTINEPSTYPTIVCTTKKSQPSCTINGSYPGQGGTVKITPGGATGTWKNP